VSALNASRVASAGPCGGRILSSHPSPAVTVTAEKVRYRDDR